MSQAERNGPTILKGKNTSMPVSLSLNKKSNLVSNETLTFRDSESRTLGRAPLRTILNPPISNKSNISTTGQSHPSPIPPRSLAAPPTLLEEKNKIKQSKSISVTSTSTNKVKSISSRAQSPPIPLPLPVAQSLKPQKPLESIPESIFDEAPVEASLEYLTRPHRSWNSAIKIRELTSRRIRERQLAIESRSASISLSNSTRMSTPTSLAGSSELSYSVHSAPPTVGRLGQPPFSFGSGSSDIGSISINNNNNNRNNNRSHINSGGKLRRGRFGTLPITRQEPLETLAVGGSRLAPVEGVVNITKFTKPSKPTQINQQQQQQRIRMMIGGSDEERGASAPLEGRGRSTLSLGGSRAFAFSMQ